MKQELLREKCNKFMDEVMNLNDLPGLAIGVSAGESAEFVGVRGFRDYAARDPLKEDSIFHCASVSKLFTSSAIMKLVEAGALRLDDRLCEILPDLNIADKRFEEIRLWNMLTHTSGLDDVDDYRWYDFETDDDSLRRCCGNRGKPGSGTATSLMRYSVRLCPSAPDYPMRTSSRGISLSRRA